MLQTITGFIVSNASILISVVIIVILVYMLAKKQYKIFIQAILEAEVLLNTEGGQKKLEYAVIVIKNKIPILLKPFFTKRLIVTIIEHILNKGLDIMNYHGYEVDIKGNEDIKK